jgi:hypothetical protein
MNTGLDNTTFANDLGAKCTSRFGVVKMTGNGLTQFTRVALKSRHNRESRQKDYIQE